jgi:hypothetical protein
VSGRSRDPFPSAARLRDIRATSRLVQIARTPLESDTFFSLDEDLPPTTHRAPRSRCVFSPHLSAGATTT